MGWPQALLLALTIALIRLCPTDWTLGLSAQSHNQDTSLGIPCPGSPGYRPYSKPPAASATLRVKSKHTAPTGPVAPQLPVSHPLAPLQLHEHPAHKAQPTPGPLRSQLPGLECSSQRSRLPPHFLQPLSQCRSVPQSSLLLVKVPTAPHALPLLALLSEHGA